ncbi:MAG: autotransporter assembly complex protein TamA [Bacteriovoracia bacterium]
MLKLLVAILLFTFTLPALAKEKLCSGVFIYGADLNLTATEKRMICGDEKLRPYQDIPAYEARFFFKGFLQSRGYLNPEFEIRNEELHVHAGKKKEVKQISTVGENRNLAKKIDDELDKLFEDKVLSTGLLDEVEAEALEQLSYRGYPCAKVSSEAYTGSGEIRINLTDTRKYKFGEVDVEEIDGLKESALDRYYPFSPDYTFDERLLELTEKRMLRAEVVQGTYFLENCTEKSFSLSQHFIIGPPRTFRFGVGASTELGPFARVRWSHNRYKSMASILSANLQASLRSQSLNLSADSFFWNHRPRRSLLSQFEIIHESQFDYEQLVLRLKPHMKWTRDSEGFHKLYTLGPTYEAGTYHSVDTTDTKSFSSGILEGGLAWTSHTYEFFDLHPQEGEVYSFNFDARHPSLGFSDPLLKVDSSILNLGKLTDWGRGSLVGAARLNMGTTWIENELSLKGLPPTVKFFGGGSNDIRGFLLNTIPNNQGLGALTRVSLKLELRRTYLFRESVEGFTFLDSAYFGDDSWDLDRSLYYSPGVGARWLSPIGLIQGYVSRGYITDPFRDRGYFLYFGIGGIF